ncbi:MAG TPA: PIN domain-containing protein [Chloroflexota bacterium]|jgi:predicted nucleic acid-binding protein|nr:PIN domain-containing protein [Chloroflexota bacterium]
MKVANLATQIQPQTRILFDASVIIAYLDGKDAYSSLAAHLLDEFVASDRNLAVVSAVTVMEVLVRPMRSGPPEGYRHVMDFFQRFPNLTCLPLDLAIAQEAASVRAHFRLGASDAITVATAIVGQTSYILTADREWATKLKPLADRVNIVCLA